MRSAAIAAAIILGIIAVSGGQAAAPTVSAVYFYPRDQAASMTAPEADAIMADVQGWYGAQVGSTFDASPVEVVRGAKTAAQYQDNIWGDVLRELGYYCGTGVHVIFVHPSIGFTGGGSCTPNYQTGDGTAMIEEGLHTGIVAHELGHAFSLPHSTCESVMLCWWDYPDVGLLAVEIEALQASPYFWVASEHEPTPEPTPTPTPTGDDDPPCKSFKGKGKAIGRCRA